MSTKMYIAVLLTLSLSVSCQKEPEAEAVSVDKFLYVTSGLCYSGNGITTFTAATASNQILKINASTGVRESILADYFAAPASGGDTPLSVVDWDQNNLLIFVRNVNAGRLEIMSKTGGVRNIFGTSPAMSTIISAAPKAMEKSPDGGVLMTRTGTIEKINASGVRSGTGFVLPNLGATCGTANVLYTSIAISATGRIITANAAASPNNRVISVPPSGASGSCDAGIPAPVVNTYATAMAFDKINGKLLVAYAGPTLVALVNSIHSYDYDETTGAMTNDQVIYDASLFPATHNFFLFGISAMTLDSETNSLYVATAISNATTVVNYAIEKLSYDATKIGSDNSAVLTRSGNLPFYNYGVDTKCISSIVVGS